MWKRQRATNLLPRFILSLFITTVLLDLARALSDKRLCADENCKEIISTGYGLISYRAGEEGMVSFNINSPIRIKSKSAGNDPLLWGIEVNGREGYAPKKYIREIKKFKKDSDLKYIVNVEPRNLVPDLATSEKFIGQENSMEATSTKPLNDMPESSESPLKNGSTEKFTPETSPVATPVISEIVDGTEIPVADSSPLDESVEVERPNISKIDTENVIEDEYSEYDEEYEEENSEDEEQTKVVGVKINAKKESSEEINNQSNEESENLENIHNQAGPRDNKSLNKEKSSLHDPMQKLSQTKNENVDGSKPRDSLGQISKNTKKADEYKNTRNVDISGEIYPTYNVQELPNAEETKEEKVEETKNADVIKNVGQIDATVETYPAYNVQNQNDNAHAENSKHFSYEKNETSKKMDPALEDVKPHDDMDEFIKPSTYNSAKVSTDADNDKKLSLNRQTAAKTSTEPEIIVNVETKEMRVDNSNYPEKSLLQQLETDMKTKNEDLNSEHKKTKSFSFYEANMPNSTVDTDVGTLTSSDKSKELPGDNSLHDREKNPPENEKDINNDLNTKKSNINLKKIKVREEKQSKSNSIVEIDNSKASKTLNIQEVNQEIQSKSSKIDKGIEIDTFSKETEKLPYEENMIQQPTKKEFTTSPESYENVKMSSDTSLSSKEEIFSSTPDKESAMENVKITTSDDIPTSLPAQSDIHQELTTTNMPPNEQSTKLSTQIDFYQELTTTNMPPNDNSQRADNLGDNLETFEEQTTESDNSMLITPRDVSHKIEKKDEQYKELPSSKPQSIEDFEVKENKGLFATIMGTVNNVLSINKKNRQNEFDADQELDMILFSKISKKADKIEKFNEENNFPYCKNIGPNGDCPETEKSHESSTSHFGHTPKPILNSDLTFDSFLKNFAAKIIEMSELLAFLVIVAMASLFFLFGYYCFCNSSREGALLSKLNQLESSLLASHKENAILKHNLMSTRHKLVSIEDNSFGSNDMVASLKKELEEELLEKTRLQEQITVLQKELENAADAGIELNRIVSELLSNQTGDESIISSVEELQKQLNEQQNTIFEINASLAEKSRENSELQLLLAEQNARYETELANVQRDNDELEHEKGNLMTKLEEMKNDFDKDITAALEGKNFEIKRLQNEILDLTNKLENEHTKWQTSVAKIEALEECLKNIRRDPNVNISEVIDVVNIKAQLIETQKKCKSLKERLEMELDSKKLAENQLEMVSAEVEKLKQDFNQSEKDKLEAQTRLEVLSNYFKDKESQLQKELSLKEAMWLKQQGETSTTVDRVTVMQEEIQSLKSQNDSLRAEIEAQVAAHKAQTGTLENRAHETWLAARQSDRRYEEARAEAMALRRKLTALAGGNINEANKPSVASAVLGDELTQAPSPIHMESPGSPMLGRLPPPPFLPPPFMGPPPPFMGMPPPPPFVPPGEMRPAPLGRIMSPPPQHLDYDDYLDYESNNTWHRHTYSPPPRTYRSLSPTDSRYNYDNERDLLSKYDTETDFSPPPSPRESRRRDGNSSERIDSNTKISYGNTKKFNMSNKGPLSSGSEKSFNNPSYNDTKPKKGSANSGGKTLV